MALRALCQVGINAGYSIMDAFSLECARKHNGSYNMIFIWQSVLAGIAPTIGGYLIKDSDDPNVESDYSLNFYVADCMMVFCAAMTLLTLNVHVKTGENQSMIKNLKKMANPAIMIYFGLVLITGICFGTTDTYVNLYLQEELGAPSSMIGAYL